MPSMSEHEIRLQLQRALDDPQWPQHAEVSKDLLRGLAGLLHQLQGQALLQSSPKGASTGTEREAFEQWFKTLPPFLEEVLSVQADGGYEIASVNWAWEAWQARAALTGAAPADANVGDLALFAEWKGYDLPLLNSEGRFDEDWLHREFVAFKAGRARPTAPEPSAPADKAEDALSRARSALISCTTKEVTGEFYPVIEYWFCADKVKDAIAAIDRMRSESGKGGKL